MATGWAREGAVQDQIDDTVKDGVLRAKSRLPQGPSADQCSSCEEVVSECRNLDRLRRLSDRCRRARRQHLSVHEQNVAFASVLFVEDRSLASLFRVVD